MKSIDEAGVEWHLSHPDADKEETWKAGANYVLEQIENFIKDSDLGNSAEEKFYKLDILADIHEFIHKLKEK